MLVPFLGNAYYVPFWGDACWCPFGVGVMYVSALLG